MAALGIAESKCLLVGFSAEDVDSLEEGELACALADEVEGFLVRR